MVKIVFKYGIGSLVAGFVTGCGAGVTPAGMVPSRKVPKVNVSLKGSVREVPGGGYYTPPSPPVVGPPNPPLRKLNDGGADCKQQNGKKIAPFASPKPGFSPMSPEPNGGLKEISSLGWGVAVES